MPVRPQQAITSAGTAFGSGAVVQFVKQSQFGRQNEFADVLTAGAIGAAGFFGATTARTDLATSFGIGAMDGGSAILGQRMTEMFAQGFGGGAGAGNGGGNNTAARPNVVSFNPPKQTSTSSPTKTSAMQI